MEGERGKLRQSLEELQQLHSQVSTFLHVTVLTHLNRRVLILFNWFIESLKLPSLTSQTQGS